MMAPRCCQAAVVLLPPAAPAAASKGGCSCGCMCTLQARMDADPDWPPQKTVWRGVLHQHAAGAALAGGIMLIIGAPGGRAKAGCAVYAGQALLSPCQLPPPPLCHRIHCMICHCSHAPAPWSHARRLSTVRVVLRCRRADAAAVLLRPVPCAQLAPRHPHLASAPRPRLHLHVRAVQSKCFVLVVILCSALSEAASAVDVATSSSAVCSCSQGIAHPDGAFM